MEGVSVRACRCVCVLLVEGVCVTTGGLNNDSDDNGQGKGEDVVSRVSPR